MAWLLWARLLVLALLAGLVGLFAASAWLQALRERER
jgi:hypothetical protein